MAPIGPGPVNRESLLVNELAEIHNYIRSWFTIYMSWYTATLTVNVLAMGWLIGSYSQVCEALRLAHSVFSVAALWDLMGIAATLSLRRSIVLSDARIAAILGSLSGREEHHRIFPRSPIPRQSTSLAFWLAALSLSVLVLLWTVLVCFPSVFPCPAKAPASYWHV
jgi:hypothetical protein